MRYMRISSQFLTLLYASAQEDKIFMHTPRFRGIGRLHFEFVASLSAEIVSRSIRTPYSALNSDLHSERKRRRSIIAAAYEVTITMLTPPILRFPLDTDKIEYFALLH